MSLLDAFEFCFFSGFLLSVTLGDEADKNIEHSPFPCTQKTFLSCCAGDIWAGFWAWGGLKLSSANGIKKVNLFCIAGREMIVMGWGHTLLWPRSKPITATVLCIFQQPMLQSRIRQIEVIL